MTGQLRALTSVSAAAILFACFFLLTARSIGDAFPSTDTALFDQKLKEMSEASPPRDLIFVGSSRVYRHVHPATFDSVLAAQGIHVHSYNLGNPGTNAFETPYQLRTIFERDPESHIRWVFVALEGLEWNLEEMNITSDRVSRYFGLRTFLRAARVASANAALTDQGRRAAAVNRLAPLFRHLTAYARGGTWLRDRIEPQRASASPLLERHEDGFLSLDTAYAYASGTVREDFDDRIDTFTRNRDRRALRKERRDSDTTDVSYQAPVLGDLLAEIDGIAHEHGAQVVFFERNFSPGAPDLQAMKRAGRIDHLISLEDPARYPALHDESNRFDGGHFNAEGAEILTRHLAEAFVPIAERIGGAQ